MTLYERYKKDQLDLTPFGLERRDSRSDYFCTPIGARAFAWSGVDGIHYCFIRGFGEMIFVVSPMGLPGHYVHPVAKSFEDFLRLLMACGGEAAIEQAALWSGPQFSAYLETYPPAEEQRAAVKLLREKYGLAPMEDPFGYLRELREGFDHSALRFKKGFDPFGAEAAPVADEPKWEVHWGGGFYDRRRLKPGIEVPVGHTFRWGNEIWHIPAVYLCAQGLVMDIFAEIDHDLMAAFLEKWGSFDEEHCLTEQEQEQAEAENPMNFQFRPDIEVNGLAAELAHGSGQTWMRAAVDGGREWDTESRRVLEHYGLETGKAWLLYRYSFPWPGKRLKEITSLKLILKEEPGWLPGGQLDTPAAGESVTLTHPVTGEAYTLTVEETVQDTVDMSCFADRGMVFPDKYTRMTYRLFPDLAPDALLVQDSGRSNPPRVEDTPQSNTAAAVFSVASEYHRETGAASVGIIGGADGPTAFYISGLSHRTVCSSLRFEPQEQVRWKYSFRAKARESIAVDLIGERNE